MSKIAKYLNEHILGEAFVSESTRSQFANDASILKVTPELVVNPKNTNDIRKIAKFTWQLAEKGHVMPLTARGGGSDQTGAAIGEGIIINTKAHMNNILMIDTKSKEKIIHLQTGTLFSALNKTLKTHGYFVSSMPNSADFCTVGGAAANNSVGNGSPEMNSMQETVTKLEVVLANGDVIETGRLTKKELSKKKGLQTLEGDIYRKLDSLIDDNKQLIADEISGNRDNVGYSGISSVKKTDGSFDLTPIFIGSQGTLGIITELVLRIEPAIETKSIIIAAFKDSRVAHDAADLMIDLKPTAIDIIDGSLFEIANGCGKTYPFTSSDNARIESVLFVSFSGLADKSTKKAIKKLSKLDTTIYSSTNYSSDDLMSVREVSSIILQSAEKDYSYPSFMNNSSIDFTRREEFLIELKNIGKKHHIDLPVQINWLNGIVSVFPKLNLHTVSDKQKTFKLMSEYLELVAKFDGSMSAQSGEGRLKASLIYSRLNPELLNLYKSVRDIFDPLKTLNPGVKQQSDLKSLIVKLDSDFDNSAIFNGNISY